VIRQVITDPDLRNRIGQAGLARVLDEFDLRANNAPLAKVFRSYSIKE
jgi:hypothetical protein